MINFTIGCDPEIFLKDSVNGKYRSVVGLIGGDKWNPRPMEALGMGFGVLEDNVAVEFNIPPATDWNSFRSNIRKAMSEIRTLLPAELEFDTSAAVSFPEEELQTEAAKTFGCEPDFNAWTKNVNERPCAEDSTLRSAGGHVHIGTELDPIEVIRAMDLFAGVSSLKYDTNQLRRNLYGKAGAFRPKPYGVEYRTLSNFWIFSDDLIKMVYDQTQRALEFVASGKTVDEETGLLIQRAINNGDMNCYGKLASTYGL